MNINFYKEFEDKFRGSRSVIKDRLQVYLPFIAPLKEIYSEVHAIDLGCGRGEFVEILNENGITAQGVDLDDGMLAICREKGLNVHKGEALSFLKKISTGSQSVVTAIHLAEHLPFEDQYLLVKECFRVLKPAGLLIIETPNPENIVVGSSSFYNDPTHCRPIPVELLEFIVEHNGYEKVKSLRLQELIQPSDSTQLSLFSVLNGVSPDYAVIALKQADPKVLEKFSGAFAKRYGYNLADKVLEYDSILEEKFADNPLRLKVNDFENEFTTIKQRQCDFENEFATIKQRQCDFENEFATIKQKQCDFENEFATIKQKQCDFENEFATIKQKQCDFENEFATIKQKQCYFEKEFAIIKQKNCELENKMEKVFASKSWNYTKPLRWLGDCLRQVFKMKRKNTTTKFPKKDK